MTFDEALDRWPEGVLVSLLEEFLVENELLELAEDFLSEAASDEDTADDTAGERASG